MISKERMRLAFAHKEVDRVPILELTMRAQTEKVIRSLLPVEDSSFPLAAQCIQASSPNTIWPCWTQPGRWGFT